MGKPPKIYPEKVADQLGSKLEHLAQNPKGLQVKDLVFRLRPKIESAQQAGYTLEDIVQAFKEEGVDLTLNTLKRYLQESRSLSPASSSPQLPPSEPKPAKPKVERQQKPKREEASSEKPQLTNTNEDGFQEMRSDDEL